MFGLNFLKTIQREFSLLIPRPHAISSQLEESYIWASLEPDTPWNLFWAFWGKGFPQEPASSLNVENHCPRTLCKFKLGELAFFQLQLNYNRSLEVDTFAITKLRLGMNTCYSSHPSLGVSAQCWVLMSWIIWPL